VYCGRCVDRRGRGTPPLAVAEPDRRRSATVDMNAEDWADMFVMMPAVPHLEVWELIRYGRRAAAMIGVAAAAGMADRSPYLRARRKTVRRTHLRLLTAGRSYEFSCRVCRARPRVGAERLREVARQALARRAAVRAEPSGRVLPFLGVLRDDDAPGR
jgi:hypothetical protein